MPVQKMSAWLDEANQLISIFLTILKNRATTDRFFIRPSASYSS